MSPRYFFFAHQPHVRVECLTKLKASFIFHNLQRHDHVAPSQTPAQCFSLFQSIVKVIDSRKVIRVWQCCHVQCEQHCWLERFVRFPFLGWGRLEEDIEQWYDWCAEWASPAQTVSHGPSLCFLSFVQVDRRHHWNGGFDHHSFLGRRRRRWRMLLWGGGRGKWQYKACPLLHTGAYHSSCRTLSLHGTPATGRLLVFTPRDEQAQIWK